MLKLDSLFSIFSFPQGLHVCLFVKEVDEMRLFFTLDISYA